MRGSVLIQDLEYADDMALVSDPMDTLEEVLRSLDSVCSGVGLSISSKKTKILAVLPSPHCPPPRPVSLKPEEQRFFGGVSLRAPVIRGETTPERKHASCVWTSHQASTRPYPCG